MPAEKFGLKPLPVWAQHFSSVYLYRVNIKFTVAFYKGLRICLLSYTFKIYCYICSLTILI